MKVRESVLHFCLKNNSFFFGYNHDIYQAWRNKFGATHFGTTNATTRHMWRVVVGGGVMVGWREIIKGHLSIF